MGASRFLVLASSLLKVSFRLIVERLTESFVESFVATFFRGLYVTHFLDALHPRILQVREDVCAIATHRVYVRGIVSAGRWVFEIAVELVFKPDRLFG